MYSPSAFHQVSSGIRRLSGTARDQLQIHCPSLPENPQWICAGLYRTVSLWADCTTNSWPCNSYSCTAISEASPCYQSDPNSRVLFCWGEATKPKVLCYVHNIIPYYTSSHAISQVIARVGVVFSRAVARRVKMQPTSEIIVICMLTNVIKCLLSIPE